MRRIRWLNFPEIMSKIRSNIRFIEDHGNEYTYQVLAYPVHDALHLLVLGIGVGTGVDKNVMNIIGTYQRSMSREKNTAAEANYLSIAHTVLRSDPRESAADMLGPAGLRRAQSAVRSPIASRVNILNSLEIFSRAYVVYRGPRVCIIIQIDTHEFGNVFGPGGTIGHSAILVIIIHAC